MLSFKIESGHTDVVAQGSESELLKEAIALEAQIHQFVYRLGTPQYMFFLLQLVKITESDDFMSFLEKEPENETRISIPIPHKDGDNDGQ